MRELIYKDEVYKAIDNCICDSWYRISPSEAKMNIRHLVSDANEVDRPQGEWIWVEHPVFKRCKCSLCGYCRQLKIPEPDKFCPNCGAKMKGE